MKNNIETDYLIFVSSDGKKNGYEIFNDRIKQNLWPIYVKTPQLINVKIGKKIIFYIAGNGVNSQHFIASAIIDRIEDQKNTDSDPNQEFKQILFNVKFSNLKMRCTGSAALDLAYVASGRLDGYFQNKINLWDVAAGVLMVKEAGGIVNDISKFDINNIDIKASSATIYDKMLENLDNF